MANNNELLKQLFQEKGFNSKEALYKAISVIDGPLFLTQV